MNKKRKAAFHVFGTLVLVAVFLWLLRSHGLEHNRRESLQKPPDTQVVLSIAEASGFEQLRGKNKLVVELLGDSWMIFHAPISGIHYLAVDEVFPPKGAIWVYMLPHEFEKFTTYAHEKCPVGINVDKQGKLVGFNFSARPSNVDFNLPRPVKMNVRRAYEVRISGSSAYHGSHFWIRKDHKGRGISFASGLGVGRENNQNRVGK